MRRIAVLPQITLSSGDSIRGRHPSFPLEDSGWLDAGCGHLPCSDWWLGMSRRLDDESNVLHLGNIP